MLLRRPPPPPPPQALYDGAAMDGEYYSSSESDSGDDGNSSVASSQVYYIGKGRRRRPVNREEMRRELFRKAGISTKYVKRLPHAKRVDAVQLGRGSSKLYEELAGERPVDKFYKPIHKKRHGRGGGGSGFGEGSSVASGSTGLYTTAASPQSPGSPAAFGSPGSPASQGSPGSPGSPGGVGGGGQANAGVWHPEGSSSSPVRNHSQERLKGKVVPRMAIQLELAHPDKAQRPSPCSVEALDAANRLIPRDKRMNPPVGQQAKGAPLSKARGAEQFFTYIGQWEIGKMHGDGKVSLRR